MKKIIKKVWDKHQNSQGNIDLNPLEICWLN